MTWKNEIQMCFGLADRRFAGHPSDQQRAYKVLGELLEKNISMAEVEKELRDFLSGNPSLHVDEQIARVRLFYAAWLDD